MDFCNSRTTLASIDILVAYVFVFAREQHTRRAEMASSSRLACGRMAARDSEASYVNLGRG